MFTAGSILERVKQQPFKPVRIITSSGQQFDVFHPDLVMVGRQELTIGTPRSEAEPIYDQQTRVSILHVTALQDLPAKPRKAGKAK